MGPLQKKQTNISCKFTWKNNKENISEIWIFVIFLLTKNSGEQLNHSFAIKK